VQDITHSEVAVGTRDYSKMAAFNVFICTATDFYIEVSLVIVGLRDFCSPAFMLFSLFA